MEIPILYEDKWLLACCKPAGLASEEPGLPQLLRQQPGTAEIYCVHRLDKAASGVMVYAKSTEAAARLSRLIADRRFAKEYLAVVQGCPEEPSGQLRDLLFRDAEKNKSYVVQRIRRGVREAALEYTLLENLGELSLVKIRLLTGRSHQIRVQFSHRAMPLVGDTKYGSRFREAPLALWSCRLSFVHPFTDKPLSFFAPPPEHWPWSEFVVET